MRRWGDMLARMFWHAHDRVFHRSVPGWCFAATIGFLVGAGITYSAFDWRLIPRETPRFSAGERPFPLNARGWVNGPAPSWASLTGKVVVVDVWTDT